tara:strand:- start:148 stop:450 length:303 start_codon:yes stop_codon:yes gene_type:complete
VDSNVVRVNILGQEYVMKTSANPQYIKDVAKYVNEKMDEIKETGVDSSSQQLKIAVLACMNITAECFDIKSKSNNLLSEVENQALKISEYIDKKVDSIEK